MATPAAVTLIKGDLLLLHRKECVGLLWKLMTNKNAIDKYKLLLVQFGLAAAALAKQSAVTAAIGLKFGPWQVLMYAYF